jgi:hypothetical protein
VGRWGHYPWFEEHGPKLIHPEDLESFRALFPYGKVFECVAADAGQITLSHGGKSYRVGPELFRPLPIPLRRVGDEVLLKEGNRRGVVVEQAWHHQKNQAMYFLRIDGKKKSKRYWESDFRS